MALFGNGHPGDSGTMTKLYRAAVLVLLGLLGWFGRDKLDSIMSGIGSVQHGVEQLKETAAMLSTEIANLKALNALQDHRLDRFEDRMNGGHP